MTAIQDILAHVGSTNLSDTMPITNSKSQGSNLAIVAIPSEDDYVWKISSEKIPHLTICMLGEHEVGPEIAKVVSFVDHAAKTSLHRFGLSVDRRGELGDNKADVLFFQKSYSKEIENFRSALLQNDVINKLYISVDQYPEWTPHLTLGYPDTPANPDDRDYPGIHWVSFDRIAVWTGDYEGPEVILDSNDDLGSSSWSDSVASVLEHHGTKGMKWGVRKGDGSPTAVTVTQKRPGTRVSATGGKNQPAHADAIKVAEIKRKAKASSTDSLSNVELKALVERMNLETNLSRLQGTQKSLGKKFVTSLFKDKKTREKTVSALEDAGKAVNAINIGKAIKNVNLSGIGG